MPSAAGFICTYNMPVAIFVVGMIDVSQAITYNKQLREQIDNLRRERLMFEAINGNLDKELARIKRSIAGTLLLLGKWGSSIPHQVQSTAAHTTKPSVYGHDPVLTSTAGGHGRRARQAGTFTQQCCRICL
jgi:hypothetical protein